MFFSPYSPWSLCSLLLWTSHHFQNVSSCGFWVPSLLAAFLWLCLPVFFLHSNPQIWKPPELLLVLRGMRTELPLGHLFMSSSYYYHEKGNHPHTFHTFPRLPSLYIISHHAQNGAEILSSYDGVILQFPKIEALVSSPCGVIRKLMLFISELFILAS